MQNSAHSPKFPPPLPLQVCSASPFPRLAGLLVLLACVPLLEHQFPDYLLVRAYRVKFLQIVTQSFSHAISSALVDAPCITFASSWRMLRLVSGLVLRFGADKTHRKRYTTDEPKLGTPQRHNFVAGLEPVEGSFFIFIQIKHTLIRNLGLVITSGR